MERCHHSDSPHSTSKESQSVPGGGTREELASKDMVNWVRPRSLLRLEVEHGGSATESVDQAAGAEREFVDKEIVELEEEVEAERKSLEEKSPKGQATDK